MISCSMNQWPIVRMHFGSHPTYDDVKDWLKQCDSILERKQKFIVIVTFEDNYQFQHESRILQAKWFKSVKSELKKSCLGMLRVTQDQVMIKKINTPAMNKGMPFRCIAVDNADFADMKALDILSKEGLLI